MTLGTRHCGERSPELGDDYQRYQKNDYGRRIGNRPTGSGYGGFANEWLHVGLVVVSVVPVAGRTRLERRRLERIRRSGGWQLIGLLMVVGAFRVLKVRGRVCLFFHGSLVLLQWLLLLLLLARRA